MNKQIKNRVLALTLSLVSLSVTAAPVTYLFCIKSNDFPTFKAEVAFRAVDFGEYAAKQMVINRIKPHLKGDFEIAIYNPEDCPCDQDCPLLEVTADDYKASVEDAEAASFMGSAAESLDMIIYSAKEIFTNPGGFLKKTFFGESKDIDG